VGAIFVTKAQNNANSHGKNVNPTNLAREVNRVYYGHHNWQGLGGASLLQES
jgi:hypothetical protein